MNAEASLVMQGMQLAIDRLVLEVGRQRKDVEEQARFKSLPEWVTLEQAAAVKGGPALITYRQKKFLQPCCGLNWRKVGGRRCWHRDDVLAWIGITDAELVRYAQERGVKLPENYEQRGAG